MRKLFVVAAVVTLSVSGLSTATAMAPSVSPRTAAGAGGIRALVAPSAVSRLAPATYERRVIQRTNHRRTARHRVRLHKRRCVNRFANRWARHMASSQRMVHQDLRPILRRCGLRMVGENIAYGYPDAHRVIRAWMHSPGHRANILQRKYRRIGVGAVRDSHGVMWVSQVFGRR